MKSIIFDLDLTLVDTTCLEDSRHQRNWQEAYRLIPNTTMYEGMKEVLDIIRKNNIKMAIVSTSPRSYVEKIVSYYNIPAQHIVSYHDAKPIKPHPAQMLKALELLGEKAGDVISFGDRCIDIQASNAAGIESVACFWGTKEKGELLHSGYSHAIISPKEILTLIR
jgi:HAD superfamily hydrolase (TIGR01509 family)